MQGRVNTHEGISVCMLRRSPSNGSGWSAGSRSWGGHTQGWVNVLYTREWVPDWHALTQTEQRPLEALSGLLVAADGEDGVH